MAISRRMLLKGASALPLLAGNLAVPAFAQIAPNAGEIPPILFVHGKRPRRAVDHDAVADGVQRRAA